MGKKASLKIDLGYDYEDVEENYSNDYDFDDDELQINPPPKKQTKVPNNKKPNQSKTSIHDGTQTGIVSVKLYHRRPVGMESPFCSLLLNGHDILVVHVARFLELRSIAALGCTNKALDKILTQEFLYINVSTDNGGASSSFILPCLRGIVLPRLRCPRLVRGLAMESSLFSKRNGPRNRNLTLLNTVQSKPDQVFLHSAITKKSCSCVTTVSDRGEVLETNIVNPNPTNNRASSRGGGDVEGRNNIVLASALSPNSCATITMPVSGSRRYVVSLIPTTRGSATSGKTIIWQQEIHLTPSLRSTGPPSVRFDDTHTYVVVVVSSSRICVFSSDQKGTLLWDLALEKQQQPWHAWTVRDRYIIAYANKKSVLIFDILQQRLVASGSIPSAYKKKGFVSSKTIHHHHYNSHSRPPQRPQIHAFRDCIWIASYPVLFRTGCILKRLKSRCTTTAATTPTPERSSQNKRTPPLLSIKKFHVVVPDLASRNPLFRCCRCGDNDRLLCVADGNLIRVFCDDKNVVEDDGPRQQVVLCAEASIENIWVDSIKVVCCVNDGKKRHIEMLRLDTGGKSSLYESVFVKNAAAFVDRYTIDRVEIRGNVLLVSYNGISSKKSELRIFRLSSR